jgi:hypothetical protein
MFGLAMTISGGIKSALDASVFGVGLRLSFGRAQP